MNISNIARFWALVVLFTIGIVWLLKDMLAPFVVGLAVAYLLDPVVEKITQKLSAPRWSAVSLVLLVFIVFVTVIGITIAPFVIDEIISFYKNLPYYTDKLVEFMQPLVDGVLAQVSPEDIAQVKEQVGKNVGTFFSGVGDVVNQLWTSSLALIDIVSFLVITPVVAFYLMLDWQKIKKTVDDLLPRQHLKTIRGLFHEFDLTLSGFIRGQTMVCLFLGIFYALGLSFAGLNFGIAIGFMAGILSFIPYIGSFFGLITSVGVALVQFDGLTMPLVIAAIFFAGQAIEGNVLTPKWVGEKVGLHAVWVIFALMAGGSLLGFTGLLLAVPVAALMGVVVRFMVTWYKGSVYYKATPLKMPKKKRKK